MENKLGLMTGRPTSISPSMCSSPFPLPWEEDELEQPAVIALIDDPNLRDRQIDSAMASSGFPDVPYGKSGSKEDMLAARLWLRDQPANSGLYFLYSCDLAMVTQGILDRIYGVNSMSQRGTSLRSRVEELQEKVDSWLSSLPASLDFTRVGEDDQAYDEKIRLAFQYHSARILLGRPSICRRNTAQKPPTDQQSFDHNTATSALNSAIQIALLILEEFNSGSPHHNGAWWCRLHYTMQAATLIILEISFGSVHMPGKQRTLLQLAKNCIKWLHKTSEHSIASHRAWLLCDNALRRLAPPLKLDVIDLPSRPFWQGQRPSEDYFGFCFNESKTGPLGNMRPFTEKGSATRPVHKSQPTGPSSLESDLMASESSAVNSPAAAAEYIGGGDLPSNAVSDDILHTFFSEFGD